MSASAAAFPGLRALGAHSLVREATEADAVEHVTPRVVVEPRSSQGVAETLAWASRERLRVVIRGGGTKMGWARRPEPFDVLLSMAALNHLIVHADGDLTASVEAGMTLDAFNRVLAEHRQYLALDAGPGATIGGLIATNDSGSLRHRFGTPRDLLIGIHLATTDGRLVKAGGNVVKNVAGYDLGRLMSGSNGTFAAIVSATFKLAPTPSMSQTLVASLPDTAALGAAVAAITASQLEPTAFDVRVSVGCERPGIGLFLCFASTADANAAEVAAAARLIGRADITVLQGRQEAEVWRGLASEPWRGDAAVYRASWMPASIEALANELTALSAGAGPLTLVGRAGVASGLVTLDGDAAAQQRVLQTLRASGGAARNVVVLRAAEEVKARVGVWPPIGGTEPILAAIKKTLDPAGILNAGRGPV